MAGELLLPQLKLTILFAYTSHFFDRYRERYLKKPSLTMLDTICRFFSRNGLMFNPCEADNRLWTAMKDENTNERIDGRCALLHHLILQRFSAVMNLVCRSKIWKVRFSNIAAVITELGKT